MKYDIIDRISELCEKHKLDFKTDLSNAIGMGQKTVNNYMNRKRKVSYEFMENIVKNFDVDANWLITGNGDMTKSSTNRNDSGSAISPLSESIKILTESNKTLTETNAYITRELAELKSQKGGAADANSAAPKEAQG